MKLQLTHLVKKLRLVDYLIILIVLGLIYLLFRFFNPEEQWLTITVLDDNVPIHQAGAFRVGDTEIGPTGKITAELLGINRVDSEEKFDRTLISLTPLPEDVFVKIRVLAKVNSRTKEYQYKNRTLFVGAVVDFQFDSGYVRGGIIEIEGLNKIPPKISKEVTVELLDQPGWLAESINIGDSEMEDNGQWIIEVLSKEVIPVFDNSTSRNNVDIRLKLKAFVTDYAGELLLRNNMQLLIGNNITFRAGNTLVKDARIIEIE